MTGRARGRSRGRARPREEEEAPRPGNRAEEVSGNEILIYSRTGGLTPAGSNGMGDRGQTGLVEPGLHGATGYTPPISSMATLGIHDDADEMSRLYQSDKDVDNSRDAWHNVRGRRNDDGPNFGYKGNDRVVGGRGRGIRVGQNAENGGNGRFANVGQKAENGGRGRFANVGQNVEGPRDNRRDVQQRGSATAGRLLPVTANYFELIATSESNWYQYHVDFSPEVHSSHIRHALLKNHKQLLGPLWAFNWQSILILPTNLGHRETVVYSTRETDDTAIRITIKRTNELPPNSRQCIQIYNNIFKKVLKMEDLVQIGRNYYNAKAGKEYPEHRLKLLPGYLASILEYEGGRLFLNMDVSHKVIRTESALEFMYNMNDQVQRENERNPERQQDFFRLCEHRIVGAIVITLYNNKTYRIDKIEWEKNPMEVFPLRDGSTVTYKEYYRRHYDIHVEDELQPLFLAQSANRDRRRERREQQLGEPGRQADEANRIYLLPELCRVVGLSDSYQGDERAKQEVAKLTRVDPTTRHQSLSDFIKQINRNQRVREELAGWNLKIAESAVEIEARVLPTETIRMAKDYNFTYQPENACWYNEVVRNVLLNPVPLKNWLVIYDKKGEQNNVVPRFLRAFASVGPRMGILVQQPQICVINRSSNAAYIQSVQENLLSSTQLVMFIVPNKAADRYDAIKRFTCIDHPVPSQVVVLNTIRNEVRVKNIASNIAIQINCKLGGEAWTVSHPLKNLMVVGMDVYHDTVNKNRSVVAFVATLNMAFTRFYSDVLFQTRGQEVVDGLQVTFVAALKRYHQANGRLPERVVVYRDGVGDGQLDIVQQYEVEQITAAFKTLIEDYQPALCVLVVQKRISSRFFCRSGGKQVNPPPGTIVDTTVTKPDWLNFYIVSQSVRQGTVSPTHYVMVYDTMNLATQNLQKLTYKLCHVYYNWPGTIRVPAPCQYAHKLAFLTGQSLHRAPARDLADRLFFL